ncbi:hypothetical protein Vadar_023011 [Vaccinium darrowii]|uniref:Uncharacterized protein n=1 Tax=Vaccinium darrowii TaxID=229202 RepID=A0ACB7X3M8_9ERIC|nr:hypothetical protein Vadar_023011 [Vaccinium darrowii]
MGWEFLPNENFIHLFITVDALFPDHDFVIGIFSRSDWWFCHYVDLLLSYTCHWIINLDEEKTVHYFPSGIVGLISHGASIVDPTLQRGPHPKTLHDYFRTFIAATYCRSHAPLRNKTNVDLYSPPVLPPPSLHRRLGGRPRLFIAESKRCSDNLEH